MSYTTSAQFERIFCLVAAPEGCPDALLELWNAANRIRELEKENPT